MDAHIALNSTVSYELREALLVYRRDHHHTRDLGSAFITRHQVVRPEGKGMELTEGTPIEEEDLQSFLKALRGSVPVEFLPSNVLVRSESSIVWWTPPSRRPMFYPKGEGREMAPLSGRLFPQPALIFRARKGALDVRALAGRARPTPETTLFRAPYWNVNDAGCVCLGTAEVPLALSVDSISGWEKGFFESEFTHPNGANRLTMHPGGFVGLWKELAGKRAFPDVFLADANQTLKNFIHR